jgi:NADP-dependent 3-hydroxy acid dehydrogenase YdfG
VSLARATVLVTGAGKGIGAAVAGACGAAGAAVGVLDRDAEAARAVAGGIGERALALVADVADHEALARARAELEDAFGPVTALVANAGIADYSLLSDGDPDRWRRLIEVNVLGVAFAIRAVLPGMKARGAGHVVLMASIAGREAWVGEALYTASKHAVVGLGRSLRLECAGHGIAVTLVEPAIVDTPLVRATPEGRDELERYATLAAGDVARAVVFALEQPAGVGVSEIVLRAIGPEL